MSADTQAWNDYWRGAGNSAQAITGIRAGKALESHWSRIFEDFFSAQRSAVRILDMACGAGDLGRRALASAHAGGHAQAQLICADSAPDAMDASPDFPRRFVVSDAARPPFADSSFDLAVSQFGAEYAGPGALRALARLVAPGGLLACVVHLAGGGIDLECRRNIAALDIEAKANLLVRIRRFFTAETPGPDEAAALGRVCSDALAAAWRLPGGAGADFVRQLTEACRTLFENRDRYAPEDAIGWIDHQTGAVRAYRLRMESMTASAVDRAGMDEIAADLAALGFAGAAARKLELLEGGGVAAWDLRAIRSGL